MIEIDQDKKNRILKTLEALFFEAKKHSLWFYCGYNNLWFSPSELKKEHSENRYVWSVCNWALRNPNGELKRLENSIEHAQNNYDEFKKRISK